MPHRKQRPRRDDRFLSPAEVDAARFRGWLLLGLLALGYLASVYWYAR